LVDLFEFLALFLYDGDRQTGDVETIGV